jgi:two-component system cell cycle response regulator CpdR
MTTVVLLGPPLPGRDLLEHALARALPLGTRIEVGDLLTVRERRDRAAALAAAGDRAVFVAREPTESEAWREIHHHYAGMPPRLADLRWQAFLDDTAQREPVQGEVWPTIVLRGGEPIEAVVSSILRAVGPGQVPPRAPARRILVVDDDPAQLELVAGALTALGCEVTTAASAEEAIDRVREQDFELVVSDERMPGAHGTELATAMSTLRPGLRVAIVTGFPDAAAEKLGRGPNVDLVLAKPLGIVDLVHIVEEMSSTMRR